MGCYSDDEKRHLLYWLKEQEGRGAAGLPVQGSRGGVQKIRRTGWGVERDQVFRTGGSRELRPADDLISKFFTTLFVPAKQSINPLSLTCLQLI